MSAAMIREHRLTLTREDDFDPEYPSWDYSIECVTPDLCGGYQECLEPHEIDGISAADGPDDNECPGWHGPYSSDQAHNDQMQAQSAPHWPWCDEEEFEFHGVLHIWRYGWGWTVPYPGCVVAAQDSICDSAHDIGVEHGEGTFVVEDDWFDEGSCGLLFVRRVETSDLFGADS